MSAPPCLILDDDEIKRLESPLAWRQATTTNIFGSKTQFPPAFQTFKPDTTKTFPFKVNKKVSPKPSLKEGAFIKSVYAFNDEPAYSQCTPPHSPKIEGAK
jgi:hypothetical protein